MTPAAAWQWLREEIGIAGLAALAVLACALAFHSLALAPLEARGAQLDERIAQAAGRQPVPGPRPPAQALAAFYHYLDSGRPLVDSLAKLHAIAGESGLELRAGEYRMKDDGGRLVRYEIALPVGGAYAQVRAFIARALHEIPSLSLDQLALTRPRPNEARVQAELRFSLHMVKP